MGLLDRGAMHSSVSGCFKPPLAGNASFTIMDDEQGCVTVPKTASKYTVGNIVAIIVTMLLTVGWALWAFLGDHSDRFERTKGFFGVFATLFAVVLGWSAVKAIRSRRR
jgi:hypothetical protein